MSIQALSLGTEMANAIPNLWNFGVGLHKSYINYNGFIYACDYEARLNLDIIDAIDISNLEGQINNPAFIELLKSFETKSFQAIIYGADRRNYRKLKKLLKKYWVKSSESYDKEDEKSLEVLDIENVFENISFAARKIEGLKRIAIISENDASIFNNFNLSVRLGNIKKALLAIRNCTKKVIQEIG